MPGRILLDTNIVIALFGGEKSVRGRIAQCSEVFLASTALGELYYGARKSSQPDANFARIEEFAAAVAILPCDVTTARLYGEVKAALRFQGHPIPENDIWIAAVAKQYGLALATRDEHFKHVADLTTEAW
jgi:tRNA(fMet)-specific endonuclease VapC